MKVDRSFGIMQGRLTPSNGRGIQFFPFDNWEQEFYDCEKLGLNEIEWIFDFVEYEHNPLWNDEGVRRIQSVICKTGIKVKSICLDYFMRRPFYKSINENERKSIRLENIDIIASVLINMKKIGAELMEIPMVDDSSIKTNDEEKMALEFLREVCDVAINYNILVGIESDYPPDRFYRIIDAIERKNARANYDSGNSSGMGYDHEIEIKSLGDRLQNLHIKDRKLGNGTMPLGTGSADFDKVFSSLKAIGYEGSIILQAARSEDGKEKENISSQIQFVKNYLEQYDL